MLACPLFATFIASFIAFLNSFLPQQYECIRRLNLSDSVSLYNARKLIIFGSYKYWYGITIGPMLPVMNIFILTIHFFILIEDFCSGSHSDLLSNVNFWKEKVWYKKRHCLYPAKHLQTCSKSFIPLLSSNFIGIAVCNCYSVSQGAAVTSLSATAF